MSWNDKYLMKSCKQKVLSRFRPHLFYTGDELQLSLDLVQPLGVEATQSLAQTGHGHHGRTFLAENVFGGCQGHKGFGVSSDHVQVEGGVEAEAAEQVVQDAVGCDC